MIAEIFLQNRFNKGFRQAAAAQQKAWRTGITAGNKPKLRDGNSLNRIPPSKASAKANIPKSNRPRTVAFPIIPGLPTYPP